MDFREGIGLILSLIIIKMLLPRSEVKTMVFRKGMLVKVKWIDGSISKLKRGEWINKSLNKKKGGIRFDI